GVAQSYAGGAVPGTAGQAAAGTTTDGLGGAPAAGPGTGLDGAPGGPAATSTRGGTTTAGSAGAPGGGARAARGGGKGNGRSGPAAPAAPAGGGDTTGVTDKTIKIGVHAPVTGAAAFPQQSFERGIGVYADYVNRKGGIHGRKIEIVFRDDRFDPNSARSVCK